MKESVNFRYNGFKTKYTAQPTDQTVTITCGNEYVCWLEKSEFQQMLQRGAVQMIFEENK